MTQTVKAVPPDACSHLDAATLRKLQDMSEQMSETSFVRNLLERFLQGTPERLRALQAAAVVSDRETLEFQAHTLKSSCGYVGAKVMARVCQTLESSARAGDTRDAGQLVAELEASFALVSSRLTDLLAEAD